MISELQDIFKRRASFWFWSNFAVESKVGACFPPVFVQFSPIPSDTFKVAPGRLLGCYVTGFSLHFHAILPVRGTR